MYHKYVLLTSVARGGKFRAYIFCSTNLPLASTRWVRSTFKLFHALSSHTSRALLSINLYSIKKFEFILKNHGDAENQTPAGWVRSSVLCWPPFVTGRLFHLFCGWLVAKKCKIAIYFFLMSQKKQKQKQTGTFGRPGENSYSVFMHSFFCDLNHRKKVTERQKCGFAVFVKFLVAGKGDLCVEKKPQSYESVRTSVCL